MNTYKIAGLVVNLQIGGNTLQKQIKAYASDKNKDVDITISVSDEFLKKKQEENSYLTVDDWDYICTGSEFYYKLLDFNGFMLHASAVAVDNRAYLFSARSGTGKSTHTRLWQKYFGENKVLIINDDKPAVRFIDNEFYAYGTPWSGKSDKNLNIKVPLKGIVFIQRSRTNWINKIDTSQAIKLILDGTLRPSRIEKMDKLLRLIDKLLKAVPIYKMGCNISKNAVELAYTALNKEV